MATIPQTAPIVFDAVPSQEEILLREAVAGICSEFGPEYTHRKVEAGEPPSELWDALASAATSASTSPRTTAAAGSACARSRGSGRRSRRRAARCC